MKNKVDILFSEPDVFSLLPDEYPDKSKYFTADGFIQDWVRSHDSYEKMCERSKANAIRIDNFHILKYMDTTCNKGIAENMSSQWMLCESGEENKILKHGDIFQVEGFEYEVRPKNYQGFLSCCQKDSDCSCGEKVAILKLAKEPTLTDEYFKREKEVIEKVIYFDKEEELKEQLYTVDEIINKLKDGLSQYGKKRHVSGFWVLEDNVYYILNKLKK